MMNPRHPALPQRILTGAAAARAGTHSVSFIVDCAWRAGTRRSTFLRIPVPRHRWGSLKSIVLLPVVVPVHVIACIVVNAIVLCTTLDHAYATLRL